MISTRVVITIDTEEDDWGRYDRNGFTVNNISYISIIQNLFDRYGAKPTYLVSYPVISNLDAVRILNEIVKSDRCEIGTHCHPWNTPPFEEEISPENTMLCNLPYELIFKKVETLHREIINRLSIVPTSFRAGRFAFGPAVARCIHELGYQIDTSVTPFNDWSDLGGPDFWEAPSIHYRFDPIDVLSEKGNGCLLEVPHSIGFFQRNTKLCSHILKSISRNPLFRFHLAVILDKLKIINRRWLSPEVSRGHDMILLAKSMIQNGGSYLNMSFHSTSLLPGKSPFVHNEWEFQRFLSDIEVFLRFAKVQGMRFFPLKGALEIVDGKEKRT